MIANAGLTSREVQLCREAFVTGALWHMTPDPRPPVSAAREHYPMPMVSVPRVLWDEHHTEWSIRDGAICWRDAGSRGPFMPIRDLPGDRMHLTDRRARLIADLLANPTALRPADEVADD